MIRQTAMKTVRMYSTRTCPFCMMARQLLAAKSVDFEEISVDGDVELRRRMERESGRHTVPQIFIDGLPVGGYDELAALERAGRLDALLESRA